MQTTEKRYIILVNNQLQLYATGELRPILKTTITPI